MSENVVVMPGLERRDLETDTPSDDVLRAAINAGVNDVIVIGRERNGELYLAAAIADADRVVGRLMWAVQFLASHEVQQIEHGESA